MTLVEHIQDQVNRLPVPPRLSDTKAEIWKAGVRAAIAAVNVAIIEHRHNKGDQP